MINKTMERHALHALIKFILMTTAFDLWMSHERFDTFALVMNYIYNNWELCHITINIFKVHETLGTTMVLQLKDLLFILICVRKLSHM
jgi:hypothetical protein